MTNHTDGPASETLAFSRHWSSRASLVAGLLGLASLAIFFFTSTGMTFYWLGVGAGVLGVVFGIIALRHRRPDAAAVTGIVTGAIAALFGIGNFIFALIFIGAIPV
ncbi:MAG: hypothetical protein LCH36_02630 [Actinobacteria bacterium]|nr:hypothetical protein [Actinomycetota bacterium]